MSSPVNVFRWPAEPALHIRDIRERPVVAEQKTRVRYRIGSEDRLIDRLGDILREMRDWRGATARQARHLSRRHGIGYQAALLFLYRAEMRSACPRRMVICLAAAVEIGIDLSGFPPGCRIEEAELSSELRVMYWAALRRGAGRKWSQWPGDGAGQV
ncbi:hypothetical protein BJN34_36170 (plasmid) [Cupriavidus necator]|uniref:Uncharacterized protein n=1 Tax=Cupriavidus necator TaxID=106590 RepID=A0A1U9V337_CUPNE|nr:hypothetical protein BJN34_36170 [Cupriavidus necator]